MAPPKDILINGKRVPVGNYSIYHNEFPGCIEEGKIVMDYEGRLPVCTLEYIERLQQGHDKSAYHVVVHDTRCDGQDLHIDRQLTASGRIPGYKETGCATIATDPKKVMQRARQVVAQYATQSHMLSSILSANTSSLNDKLAMAMAGAGAHFTLGGVSGHQKDIYALATLFFDTAQSVIRSEEAKRLNAVVQTFNGDGLLIEGNCDHRGDTKYNYQLGLDRGTAVKKYLEAGFTRAGKSVPILTVVSYGEAKAVAAEGAEAMARDRKVTLVPMQKGDGPDPVKSAMVERGLKVVGGNVFLIDASGSMQPVWRVVQQYKFPKGSQQYSFNSCSGVVEGVTTQPDCGTPLWQSVFTVVQRMKPRQALTIVSDGAALDDNYINQLLPAARKNHIKINAVYVGSVESSVTGNIVYTTRLRDVVNATGGTYYVRQ